MNYPENDFIDCMRIANLLLYSLIIYIIGVAFHVNKFPESIWPGKFDFIVKFLKI